MTFNLSLIQKVSLKKALWVFTATDFKINFLELLEDFKMALAASES